MGEVWHGVVCGVDPKCGCIPKDARASHWAAAQQTNLTSQHIQFSKHRTYNGDPDQKFFLIFGGFRVRVASLVAFEAWHVFVVCQSQLVHDNYVLMETHKGEDLEGYVSQF